MVSLFQHNLHGNDVLCYTVISLLVSIPSFLVGILADEMGLGKTIQTIALFAYLSENKLSSVPIDDIGLALVA